MTPEFYGFCLTCGAFRDVRQIPRNDGTTMLDLYCPSCGVHAGTDEEDNPHTDGAVCPACSHVDGCPTPHEPYLPSRVHWFGEPWPRANYRAPICGDDRYRIAVPVDEKCTLCEEKILPTDRGVRYSGSVYLADDGTPAVGPIPYAHAECNLRSVTGNHLHVGGMCRHTGDCNDNSTVSYREESLLVWEMTTGEKVAR